MIDNGKISPAQFMFSVGCFIQASSLLTSFITGVVGSDAWLSILTGTVLALPLLWAFLSLAKRFPGKTLIEINELVFGKILGKMVSALYIWFFLTLMVLNLRDLGDFVNQTILPETPQPVVTGVCVAVAAIAVRNGVKSVTRYAMSFSLLSFSLMLISFSLLYNHMDFKNFLPLFNRPAIKYVQGAHTMLTIPFGEVIAFMMIIPNVLPSKKPLSKYMYLGMLIGTLALLIVVVRDTAVLGNTLEFFVLPSFVTIRMVTVFRALSRLEILFSLVLIVLLFFKVAFLFYASTLALAQTIGLKSLRPLVFSLGTIAVVYAMFIYMSTIDHAVSGQNTTAIKWTFFEILLPVSTLITAAIKGRKRRAPA